jgi:hypothetical protein
MRTLLGEALGLRVNITGNTAEFSIGQGARISYSDHPFDGTLQVRPHTILFDHGIRDYHLQVSGHEEYCKIFFRNPGGDVPFDLFAAAFWLLSRYEEYLPYKADTQNRFHYRSSLAYQYEFLQIPLVNLWLEQLKKKLLQIWPMLKFRPRRYEFISTIDIDNAYKFKFKGFVRTLAGAITDKNWSEVKERFMIIFNRRSDPFDCYDYLIDVHRKYGTKATYFLLLGDYGPNDKNHSASDLRFQELIKHLSDYSRVGIHPSYGSNNNLRQLKKEVTRLVNIVHRNITHSRQHFSMLRFPQTYQDLLQAGITSDFTMGYTNRNGFRASYCYPYHWYNLDMESVSTLTVHSFCITDNALMAQAQNENRSLMDLAAPFIAEVRKYRGQLVSIFHNDNFTPNVRRFYEELLQATGAEEVTKPAQAEQRSDTR